jgi:PAS domain S-box-containing protein
LLPRETLTGADGEGAGAVGRSVTRPMPTVAVIIADPDLRVVNMEGEVSARHGYADQDWPGRTLSELLPPGARLELEPRYRAALKGEPQSFDYWSHDGQRLYGVQIVPVRSDDGEVNSVVAVIQDSTERLRMIEELSRSESRLHESERMVGVGSWEMVSDTGALSYSPGFAHVFGLSPGQGLDVWSLTALIHDEDREILPEAFARCLKAGFAACEFRVLRPDGATRVVAAEGETVSAQDGLPLYLRGAILDVTDEREADRERLDAVSLFRQGFDAAPIGMTLTDPLNWCYLRVNDAMCRLLDRTREQLLGVSIDWVTHRDDRAADHESRRAILDGDISSFQTEKRYLRPDGSAVWVMLHVAPVHAADGKVRALFSQVIDISERKQREALFDQSVKDAVWLGRIRGAIDDDRLVLYAQPIVDLVTGETVQQELLLRMRGEDGSIIAPGDFLPVAERYGLISEIDRWVIRQAVALAAKGEPTEFNLSAASIGDPDVLRELASAIQETGADPSLLVVEVTETAVMNELEAGRRFAEQLAALGCQLALDDFGTGFATLSYLKQIPAQRLKIDVEFVRDLTQSETDERLIRGIIGIAREFDQTTIAEGIEDQATLVRLRELGVHLGQGYLLGRPEPL